MRRTLIRNTLLVLVALLVVAAFGLRWYAHRFEARANLVAPDASAAPNERAKALHDRLTVVDLHADTLLWDRDVLEHAERGQVDVPRLAGATSRSRASRW